jgi:hypothetical protein
MSPTPARGIDASGNEVQLPVAKEDLVVEDAVGVPRKILASQPVPRDLLEAYEEKVGKSSKSSDGNEAPDYSKQNNDDLEAEIKKRGLDVPTEGTGQDGNVIKKDLVAVLEKHDAESGGADA